MRTLFIILCLLSHTAFSQMSGSELLQKAIDYHDPNGKWSTFSGELTIQLETPGGKKRESLVGIDLAESYFKLEEKTDVEIKRVIENDNCTTTLNGSSDISSEEMEKYRLSCERSIKMRDYYTYLYGLPMKLSDAGTIVHDKVEDRDFQGNSYKVLKVTYDDAVGSDTWYFYFDKESYEMKLYQFYHDVEKGDGEYILLTDMVEYNGIKIPKVRKWYTNKEDKFLGTDMLVGCKEL